MKSLIIGIGGQDGSYLAESLLNRGHTVHGLYRRSSGDSLARVQHLLSSITVHPGDLTDRQSLMWVLGDVKPDHVYNMADQDHVGFSFDTPQVSLDTTANGVFHLLDSVRLCCSRAFVFQPLSATMFGDAPPPQNERTVFRPASPYAAAKVAAYYYCQFFRNHYGMHVSTGIMFNHDSPRRNPNCLVHYLFRSALQLMKGDIKYVEVGDPDLMVDIGYAGEFMSGVADMMRLKECGDFVMGTGRAYTVRQIAEAVLARCGVDPSLIRTKKDYRSQDGKRYLMADNKKAKSAFGFNPQVGLTELICRVSTRYL